MARVLFHNFNFVLEDVLNEFKIVEDYTQADAVVCLIDADDGCRDAALNTNFIAGLNVGIFQLYAYAMKISILEEVKQANGVWSCANLEN